MNKKILIIEDDKVLRENIAELLILSGYDASVAENGISGIKKSMELLPDLIVSDIMMPDTDGYSVLHALRKNQSTRNIPFIFLTAKTDNEAFRQGMKLGADDYLTKPFEDIELLDAIEIRLKKYQQSFDAPSQESENPTGPADLSSIHTSHAHVMEDLLSDAISIRLDPGNPLYFQGDKPHFVYFIEWGSIKTYQLNKEGKPFITEVYYDHQLLGHKPVIENRHYKQFAEAGKETSLRKIPANRFLAAITNERNLAKHFIMYLSEQLSKKEEELLSIAYNSVRYRIGKKLIEMSERHPENLIDLSRSELAHVVGTTPETIARTLTEFSDQGLIKTSKRNVSILNPTNFLKHLEKY
jgi:DNA-binding response OmpR family regulator